MTRTRIQKAKKTRKRAATGPLEDITRSSAASSVLVRLDELLEDIDDALDETGGWPG